MTCSVWLPLGKMDESVVLKNEDTLKVCTRLHTPHKQIFGHTNISDTSILTIRPKRPNMHYKMW